MLSCHQVTRLFSESQERPLTLQERMPLKFHTMMCAGCRNFGQQMHTLRYLTRSYVAGKDEQVRNVGE